MTVAAGDETEQDQELSHSMQPFIRRTDGPRPPRNPDGFELMLHPWTLDPKAEGKPYLIGRTPGTKYARWRAHDQDDSSIDVGTKKSLELETICCAHRVPEEAPLSRRDSRSPTQS